VRVPIHEQKSVDEPEFDAVAAEEVGAEGGEGEELGGLGTRADCALHAVVDLDLQVEELRILCFCLGQLVEEVVQQEEVVEEIAEGDRLRPGGRTRLYRHLL
jgi:hypothetical protein